MGISSKVEVVDGGSFLGFPLIPKWVGGESAPVQSEIITRDLP